MVRVVLTLYINERGTVDRVQEAEGSETLPTAFIDAAKKAFAAATFSPGRTAEAPVKSKVRIAVEFEDRAGSR